MFERILIGVDFSECGERALQVARRQFPAAQRRLLHVLAPVPAVPSALDLLEPEQSEYAQAQRDRLRLEELRLPAESALAVQGRPADCVLDEAQAWGADLIVLGTHGRRGLDHLVFGSVAEQVVRSAGVPVLTVGTLVARARSAQAASLPVAPEPA